MTGQPLHPFSLDLDLLDRMLNFEIADDPHYSGLEIQRFDDPDHGRGMLVFVNRRDDGRTDVYVEPGLAVDRANYAIGAGLGSWTETEFDTARLVVDPTGVRADVRFTDAAGRLIEVHLGDRTPGGRRMAAFLAPMGADITEPRSLPLVWMSQFDLLHRRGPDPIVRIDGRRAALGHLPAEPVLRRRLIKVTSDLCVVAVNPGHPDPVPLVADVAAVGDARGTRTVVAAAGDHEARLDLDPPLPDLGAPAVEPADGAWTVAIDGTPIVGGSWRVRRGDGETRVELDVTEGWAPRGLPPLMSIVTRVAPVFRTWPTTYRWAARIVDGDPPTMTSTWVRTDGVRGDSYRSMTGSG